MIHEMYDLPTHQVPTYLPVGEHFMETPNYYYHKCTAIGVKLVEDILWAKIDTVNVFASINVIGCTSIDSPLFLFLTFVPISQNHCFPLVASYKLCITAVMQ